MRWAQWVPVLAAALVLGTLAVVALVRWVEPKLLFPAPVLPGGRLAGLAAIQGAKELRLTAADGVPLYAWHLPARGERVVVWFDGNAACIGQRPFVFRELQEAGFDVVQVSYRGYPGSGGSPSEAGLLLDARAAWDYAQTVAPRRLVYGRSLGGGVAIALAAEVCGESGACEALVVESTFASVAEIARASFFVPRWLLRNPFDSRERAPAVRAPVLVLHGTADTLIPYAQAEALARAFPQARLVPFAGAGHNDELITTEAGWAAFGEVAGF